MRLPRLKVLGRPACYHIVNRITQGQLWLGDEEKVYLTSLLPRVAAYCGVELVTFCIMSNHFQLLIKVPEKAAADAAVDAPQLLNRVAMLYGVEAADRLRGIWQGRSGDQELEQLWAAEQAAHFGRMHDLSVFMKLLKQRFTMWHNYHHGTRGTLWTERFKSLLVENGSGEGNPLAVVAAYIDAQPVRAGIVTEAGAYPYSGYGSAGLGNAQSQAGIAGIGSARTWEEARPWYQQLLTGSPMTETLLSDKSGGLVKGMALGSLAFVMDALKFMVDLRRSFRPQSYAAGGRGERLWLG